MFLHIGLESHRQCFLGFHLQYTCYLLPKGLVVFLNIGSLLVLEAFFPFLTSNYGDFNFLLGCVRLLGDIEIFLIPGINEAVFDVDPSLCVFTHSSLFVITS